MNYQKISNILTIILSIISILCGISLIIGQIGLQLVSGGFFAYLLNIFSAPILVIYPTLIQIFGGLWVTYLISSIFIVFGTMSLGFAISSTLKTNPKINVVRYIISVLSVLLVAFIIISLIINNFSVFDNFGFWNIFLLLIYVCFTIFNFVLRNIIQFGKNNSDNQ